jgi:hypothetical protein
MFKISRSAVAMVASVLWLSQASVLLAQNPSDEPTPKPAEQTTQDNRFWQASVNGGHYMVALERISSVSRHRYVLDGTLLVDEVTVDALGQSLVRFYFVKPWTEAVDDNAVTAAASSVIERGRELIDDKASKLDGEIHNMVLKKFPDTTHSRTVEFRLLSESELTALYDSIRSSWESGRGRNFKFKK